MTTSTEGFFAEIQGKIRGIGTLPTLPSVAVEVVSMARDENATMAAIANHIDGDPAISSKLLRVANSSFYGLPRYVNTTEGAILVIGLREVQNIILSVSVINAFPVPKGKPSFDREKFWLHCSGVGLVARYLSRRLGLSFSGEEFSGGVLHDIGKIVMDQYFHDLFVESLELRQSKGITGAEAEKQVFGVSHAEVGGWMLNYWKLPLSLARVAAFHHQPEDAQENRDLVAVIALSNIMAQVLGIGLAEDKLPSPIEEHKAWKVLAEANPALAKLDPQVAFLGVREDLEEAKKLGELNWIQW